jgi:hypothetical protein
MVWYLVKYRELISVQYKLVLYKKFYASFIYFLKKGSWYKMVHSKAQN